MMRMLVGVVFLCAHAAFGQGEVDGVEVDPGVTVRVYQVEGAWEKIPAIAPDQTPNHDRLAGSIDFGNDGFGGVTAPFVTHALGWVVMDQAGAVRFRLTSDDGSRLFIGDQLVIDHDGRHGATAKESETVELDAGRHALRVEHFDAGGGRALRLEWMRGGDGGFSVITDEHLLAERDVTRVTSPGSKQTLDGRRPGDGAPVAGVHPAWTLEDLRPVGFEPKVGAMTFLPDGRLVIGTFDPLQRDDVALPDIESKEPDSLYALGNLDAGDPEAVTVTRIAGDLYEPMGLCFVDGELYVSHRRAVTRLRDTDGDGFYETHEVIGTGWEAWNYHQFAMGLVHIDGKLYTALSTAMAPPGWEGMEHNAGPNGPMRGGIVEIDIETGDTRVIAGGTRTPNGLGLAADGSLIYLDNQGTWMSANQLAEVVPGRFYGHYNWTRFVPKLGERFPQGGHASVWADRARTPSAVMMPQNEVTNSPTQPLVIEGGVYDGQVLVGELTAGGVRRVALERVNGRLQGALFRFTQGLESGVNRMAWGPDGSLYVGGMGAGGNWNWRGTQYGLQRLVPNGASVFEMLTVTATPEGLRVVFTEPVDPEWLEDVGNWGVKSFTYAHTAEYGGPKVDERGHAVTRAVASDDGRWVEISIEGLEAGRCYALRVDPVSVDGDAIWSTEAWYTMNSVPRGERARATIGGVGFEAGTLGVGALPPAEAVVVMGAGSSGVMRFEGERGWPGAMEQDGFVADAVGDGGSVAVDEGAGDLVTATRFGDVRLHVEWLSPAGGSGQLAGNSGVYLQDKYEVQILNTEGEEEKGSQNPGSASRATGKKLADNEAGAIYGVKAADVNASLGAGVWQAYDIWFLAARYSEGTKIEDARITVFWNGVLVHDDVVLKEGTGSRRGREAGALDGIETGILRLQDHVSAADGAVRFRNVWMMPLEEAGYEAGDWVDLFGQEADAWMARGGRASYAMENGELVGTTVANTPNTFYTSAETYGDFELVYEVEVDPRLNSGVQIRSEVIGGLDNRNGGLRGYQVEIDPSARAFSGGIYDEQSRGWLHPLHAAPYARRAFRAGEWNRFRVVARGPVIRTWINGVPAAEVFDAERGAGHIGFQVHDVGRLEEPLEVRFRGARLRELTARGGGISSE